MALGYIEHEDRATVELSVEGKVTKADMDEIMPRLQAFIDRHDKVRMIEIIREYAGFEASALWPGIKFDIHNLSHFTHVAVVSDIGWIGPVSKAAGAFISTKLRMFDLDEIDKARAWIAHPETA